MSKKKKDIEKEYDLPAGSLERLARTFLPGIQAFFEIEENQKAFETWLAKRRQAQKEKSAA